MAISTVTDTLSYLPLLARLGKAAKPRPLETRDCFGARVALNAQRYPEHSAVLFEGKELNWHQLNARANRYAHCLAALGLKRGDCASVLMENRIEFLLVIIALNKLGATAALINTNLTGRPLAHCIRTSNSRACIVGEERFEAIDDLRNGDGLSGIDSFLFVPDSATTRCPRWMRDLEEEASDESEADPQQTGEVTLGDTALYIFTSGTTGMPKAAVVSNRRYLLLATLSALGALRCDVNDRIYLCLPLYHGTGLFLGVGAAFHTGASMVIRRKFSARGFLPDVRKYGVTHFMYIGELCRYLLNVPPKPDDFDNPLTTVMGNGLRPDIWHEFKERFGISRVAEFYGASEGNVGFFNLLNRDCTVGTTLTPHALVKYDVDTDEIPRDGKGHCIRVSEGETGLMLGKITELTSFEGYTSSEATENKILRDVFKRGDAWFNTGDLMKSVDVGFALGMPHYQFVDRVGDTFRWKGENVSTNEVGEIVNGHPQVQFCNVYGVQIPGTDGRAGMAALLLEDGVKSLDLEGFSRHVNEQLPAYARPVFLRILPSMDTTGTFKMVKNDLRNEAYDLARVEDALYVCKPGQDHYVALDADFADTISAGKAGY